MRRRPGHWLSVGAAVALCVLAVLLLNAEPRGETEVFTDDETATREPVELLRDEPVLDGGAKSAPKPAPEPEDESTEEKPKPEDKQIVRDAYDGSVVEGVRVVREIIELAKDSVTMYSVDDKRWLALGEGDDGAYWVCRRMRLSLRVRVSGGPLSHTIVKPSYAVLDTRAWSKRRPAGLPKGWRYELRRKFHVMRKSEATVEYAAEVPRIKGLLVSARAEGFLSAWTQHDDLADPGDEVRVELTLRKAPVLTGRVVDEVGRPVPGATIRVRISVPYPAEERESNGLMVGVGWDAIGAGGNDDAHIRFERDVSTDKQTGAFRVPLPVEGELTLRVSRVGHAPVKNRFGTVAQDRELPDITLTKRRGEYRTHTLLARDGKLLREGLLLALWKKEGTAITDIIDVKVGNSGMISTVELERGMQYYVKDLTTSKPDDWQFLGKFTWDEQQTIVLKPTR